MKNPGKMRVSPIKKPPGFPEGSRVERAKGIEPSYSAWEADVLPLNYARACFFLILNYYNSWTGKSQCEKRKNFQELRKMSIVNIIHYNAQIQRNPWLF